MKNLPFLVTNPTYTEPKVLASKECTVCPKECIKYRRKEKKEEKKKARPQSLTCRVSLPGIRKRIYEEKGIMQKREEKRQGGM